MLRFVESKIWKRRNNCAFLRMASFFYSVLNKQILTNSTTMVFRIAELRKKMLGGLKILHTTVNLKYFIMLGGLKILHTTVNLKYFMQ